MYHNDRLLGANGKLILVETSGAEAIWRRPDGTVATGTKRGETAPMRQELVKGKGRS
jgi:hypothetical protein